MKDHLRIILQIRALGHRITWKMGAMANPLNDAQSNIYDLPNHYTFCCLIVSANVSIKP